MCLDLQLLCCAIQNNSHRIVRKYYFYKVLFVISDCTYNMHVRCFYWLCRMQHATLTHCLATNQSSSFHGQKAVNVTLFLCRHYYYSSLRMGKKSIFQGKSRLSLVCFCLYLVGFLVAFYLKKSVFRRYLCIFKQTFERGFSEFLIIFKYLY
jgi:hypothetical protein